MSSLQHFFNAISPVSEETWEAVGPLFEQRSLAQGEHFVEEDKVAKEIAFLESGCVRAYFTNEDGKEYNKQLFVGPALIGAYTSLLTGQRNKIPQQALTKCSIWVANYASLTALFDRHHDLERLGRKVAEHYFLEKERKELEMALEDATQRYLRFNTQYPGLEQLIPQLHIASYLGISRTQLSRLRKKLVQRS